MTRPRAQAPRTKKKAGPKRRSAQRARAGAEPKDSQEVAALVARAVELLMSRGVKACLREKLPSTIILMAAGEQVGHIGSMMGLPYPQTLQTACNGVESVYRVAAPEQVAAQRPIDEMAKGMVQRASHALEVPENRCEPGKTGD